MRIILAAAISRFPGSAGSIWNRIHRWTSLQRLGHEVMFVEELRPDQCTDRQGNPASYDACIQRTMFEKLVKQHGLQHCSCQVHDSGQATAGLDFAELVAWSKKANLLLNMSGHLTTEPVLSNCRRRAYLDEDPVFTQLWHATYGCDLNFDRHNVFFSVGQNIGTARSPVPDCGRQWHPYFPPLVTDLWPVTPGPANGAFTTIASLEAYPEVKDGDQSYGSKAIEFERFADLPAHSGQAMEVVLRPGDREGRTAERLREHAWITADSPATDSLDAYLRFIQRSRAEIGLAQHAYVQARSGWFSDRSAHYLVCGRPVLAESTGLDKAFLSGEGFLTFTDLEEAVAGVRAINKDYDRHCRAARAWAEQHLDYRRVLPPMLALAMEANG